MKSLVPGMGSLLPLTLEDREEAVEDQVAFDVVADLQGARSAPADPAELLVRVKTRRLQETRGRRRKPRVEEIRVGSLESRVVHAGLFHGAIGGAGRSSAAKPASTSEAPVVVRAPPRLHKAKEEEPIKAGPLSRTGKVTIRKKKRNEESQPSCERTEVEPSAWWPEVSPYWNDQFALLPKETRHPCSHQRLKSAGRKEICE